MVGQNMVHTVEVKEKKRSENYCQLKKNALNELNYLFSSHVRIVPLATIW